MKISSLVIFGLCVMISACSAPNEQDNQKATATEDEPLTIEEVSENVINHHLASFAENDLEAVVSDYTDGSIIITPDSTFKGIEQISSFFEGLFPGFPSDSTAFVMDNMVIENEVVYIIWHCSTPSLDIPLGTDTFIIKDGKINVQTFAAVLNPVE